MNATHIHLIVNHIAILGVVFSLPVLFFGILLNSKQIRVMAYGFIILSAVAGITTFATGKTAEGTVKEISYIPETTIEEHRKMGTSAVIVVNALALLAVTGLFMEIKNKRAARIACHFILAMASTTSALLINTGISGSEIRHTEGAGEVKVVRVVGTP